MVQGAKHMKSKNAAANGGSSPQPVSYTHLTLPTTSRV